MKLTHEHEELKRSLKRFIDEEINPHVEAWEAAEQFPAHEVFKKLGQLGFLGLTKPEAYGGSGLDYSYSVVMAETLGHVACGAIPMAIGVQTDMATPALARFGSDALCREFLVPAIAGEQVGSIGVSEPGAGSDVASVRTTARKDGDDYIINGGKMWITNSLQADWMCLLVNTSDGPAHKNKSLIMVPMNTPGITRARKKLHLSLAMSRTTFGETESATPSRYLQEIPVELIEWRQELSAISGGGFGSSSGSGYGSRSVSGGWGNRSSSRDDSWNSLPPAPPREKTEWSNRVTNQIRDNGDLELHAGDRIRHVDFGDGT